MARYSTLTRDDFTEKEIRKHPHLFFDTSVQSLGLTRHDEDVDHENREYLRQCEMRKIIYFRNRNEKKADNERRTGNEYCVFCFNACKPSRKYLSHTRLSDCPTLKHTKCGKCGELGHTRKKCQSLHDKKIRVRLRINMRPENEWDSDCNYCDGDSENWTDSSDEEKTQMGNTVEEVKGTVSVEPTVIVEQIVFPKKTTWASIAAKNI